MNTRAALQVVLDQVDYTNRACSPTEMVGAVLSKEVIQLARESLLESEPAQDLRERLAAQAHKSWSGWMAYMFSKSSFDAATGTLTIPALLMARWQRQSNTEYADLSEDEKKSDRVEADAYLRIIGEMVGPP